MAAMLAGLLGLLAFIGLGLFLQYSHSHRADGKPNAVWDCGRDDCKYRNRSMHRHPAAA